MISNLLNHTIPQVKIIYPDGRTDYANLKLEYEDGVMQSLNPKVKPMITQSESAKIPLYHKQMAVINEINKLNLQF